MSKSSIESLWNSQLKKAKKTVSLKIYVLLQFFRYFAQNNIGSYMKALSTNYKQVFMELINL